MSFTQLQKILFGWLCPITIEDYEQLHAANHPSLFERGRRRYVLIGPLSCANHSCNSFCGFAAPKSFPVSGYDTPSFATNNDPSEWNAQLLTVRDLSSDGQHNQGFRAGEEIVVRYQDSFPDCKCEVCAPKKRLKQ